MKSVLSPAVSHLTDEVPPPPGRPLHLEIGCGSEDATMVTGCSRGNVYVVHTNNESPVESVLKP